MNDPKAHGCTCGGENYCPMHPTDTPGVAYEHYVEPPGALKRRVMRAIEGRKDRDNGCPD